MEMSFTGFRLSVLYFLHLEKDETVKQTRISFFPDIERDSWESYFLLLAQFPGMYSFPLILLGSISWKKWFSLG